MSLLHLDLQTLFVVTALVIAFSGSVLIFSRGQDDSAGPLGYWGASMLAGAGGIVLVAISAVAGSPAWMVGNAFVLVGTGLSWSGARVFAGRKLEPGLLLAGPVAWLVVASFYRDGASALMSASSYIVGVAYVLATAGELFRADGEPLRARPATITVLIVHAAVYLAQAGFIVAVRPTQISDGIKTLLVLEALLHTIGMAFLFLVLVKERAESRSTRRLRQLATLDGLTGLGNRRQFDQVLDRELSHAKRQDTPLSLLMIDVDEFKAFNDSYCHQAGDDGLRAIATVIQSTARRSGDLAMRYGGEEFVVLLPGTAEAEALAIAETIRKRVAARRVPHENGRRGFVTISVGVATFCPGGVPLSPEALLRAADQALYRAKASGRNATVSLPVLVRG